jgi:nitrite reductase/ring-hydroxylating ferredoxin subunit
MDSVLESELFVCHEGEIEPGRAHGFSLTHGERTLEVVVLRHEGALLAFENRCPHLGTPLNLLPDHFLDAAGREIICSTHGARFTLPAGICVFGPCMDDELRRFPIFVENGSVKLTVPHRG